MTHYPPGTKGSDIGAAVFISGIFTVARWIIIWMICREALAVARLWMVGP